MWASDKQPTFFCLFPLLFIPFLLSFLLWISSIRTKQIAANKTTHVQGQIAEGDFIRFRQIWLVEVGASMLRVEQVGAGSSKRNCKWWGQNAQRPLKRFKNKKFLRCTMFWWETSNVVQFSASGIYSSADCWDEDNVWSCTLNGEEKLNLGSAAWWGDWSFRISSSGKNWLLLTSLTLNMYWMWIQTPINEYSSFTIKRGI